MIRKFNFNQIHQIHVISFDCIVNLLEITFSSILSINLDHKSNDGVLCHANLIYFYCSRIKTVVLCATVKGNLNTKIGVSLFMRLAKNCSVFPYWPSVLLLSYLNE